MRPLLDLVLPQSCRGCGAPGAAACPGCLSDLAGPARRTRPTPAPAGLPPVTTVAAYDGAVRSLLVAYKEEAAAALRRPLGDALARAVALACGPAAPVLLVPVPSARAQCRRRGADVVAELARTAAGVLVARGVPTTVVRGLRHVRHVADSAGLDARARAANTAGALGVRAGAAAEVQAHPVVVVDDLVTTGATLAEATRVLRAAGAHVLGAATVAATGRTRRQ